MPVMTPTEYEIVQAIEQAAEGIAFMDATGKFDVAAALLLMKLEQHCGEGIIDRVLVILSKRVTTGTW